MRAWHCFNPRFDKRRCESNPSPRHLIRDLVRGDQTFQIWGSGRVDCSFGDPIERRLRLLVSSHLVSTIYEKMYFKIELVVSALVTNSRRVTRWK